MNPDGESHGNQGQLLAMPMKLARKLVPPARRAEWAREWQAELWQLEHGPIRPSRLTVALSLGYGLIADALWLRMDFVRGVTRGSAGLCLATVASWCLVLGWVQLAIAGSLQGFVRLLASHFFGGFIFVGMPAILAAVATYPLRPLRSDHRQVPSGRFSSVWVRRSAFLSAKIALTLLLGFLSSVVATSPLREMAVGWADWVELFLFSFTVTVGLRWALLNQEQRCQKCLRMLGQPTRVGLPSRNFLDWSGTELACEDGHGRLHVAEMQGSWCWYDKWVELDSSWSSLFSS